MVILLCDSQTDQELTHETAIISISEARIKYAHLTHTSSDTQAKQIIQSIFDI